MLRKTAIGFILIVLSFSACQDYEHGPLLSFKSAEERLVNVWAVCFVQNTATNQELTAQLVAANYRLAIFINGEFEVSWNDTSANTIQGSWTLQENDTKVAWTFSGTDRIGIVGQNGSITEITRLKRNELWLKTSVNALEFQFVLE